MPDAPIGPSSRRALRVEDKIRRWIRRRFVVENVQDLLMASPGSINYQQQAEGERQNNPV
jgi:hypothetical protein